jgi:hypothetical protein
MKWLKTVVSFFGELGRSLLGEFWWAIFRDTAQDALGAYLTLTVGGFTGRLIAGKDFSSFTVCFNEWKSDPTSVQPYVCYGMVVLDYVLWAAVLARLISRALKQLVPKAIQSRLGEQFRLRGGQK